MFIFFTLLTTTTELIGISTKLFLITFFIPKSMIEYFLAFEYVTIAILVSSILKIFVENPSVPYSIISVSWSVVVSITQISLLIAPNTYNLSLNTSISIGFSVIIVSPTSPIVL